MKPRRSSIAVALAVLASLMLAVWLDGCGASGSTTPAETTPSPRASLRGGAPSHIAVVVMENEEYGSVVGSHSAPFINRLAARYAQVRSMYATSHPSLPNYFALTGGSTFGISSDCTSCNVGATSLVDQLERAHVSWKAYMEDLPHPCFTGASAGGYAKKHDPFVYYTRITDNRARCGHIVPLRQLSQDEHAHRLPKYLWITPNLCHDMHDCDVATGDRYLATLLPPVLRALGPNGLLLLTWDEGSSDDGCCRLAAGGHIATIVAGPGARRGARMIVAADHYSVLQTIEDVLGLPRLRGAACPCTVSLQPVLAAP